MKDQTPIAIASRSFSKHEELRKTALNYYDNIKFNDAGTSLKGNELISFLKGAKKAIIALENINEEILKELPELELISKYGVGLDNINLPDLKKNNVKLAWSGGVNKRAVAELALSFMLLTLRKSYFANLCIKDNNWHQVQGHNLTGKTVGIVGFGHIGMELTRLLTPFDVKVLAHDILDKKKEAQKLNVELVTLDELLKNSDVVSLHLPSTIHTRNIIDLTAIQKMKQTAVLINSARGGLINESDLLIALKENLIYGAAVDVFTE